VVPSREFFGKVQAKANARADDGVEENRSDGLMRLGRNCLWTSCNNVQED
jgi:hypothetical protein